MDHRESDRRQRLGDEIAVADRVERIGRHPVEPEVGRRRRAVERVAGAGQGAGAEGADVQPTPGVGKAPAIALGHLDVGEQVMAEEDRLGGLGVGRTRQDGVALALGQADQGILELEERPIEPVDRPARPQPQVGGDLVVPRAPGMQLAGDRPEPFGQRRLEVQVDVLEGRVPAQLAVLDIAPETGEPVDQGRHLGRAEDARPAESADMGDRPVQVVERHLDVHVDGSPEGDDVLVAVGREPSAPEPHRTSSSITSGQ